MPRPVGPWTLDKLKVLEDYLPGYLQATTRAMETIYVDAFAGPGTNRVRDGRIVDGSPLIALKAASRNGTRFSRFYFIERDPTTAAELKSSIAHLEASRRAEVVIGDVNEALPCVVQRLPLQSPTFVFLDAVGIEPKWRTIEAISRWRTELLITFPLGMSIKRNLHSPKVTEYFGTDAWRPLFDARRWNTTRGLLDLYIGELRRLGYEYTPEIDRLIKTRRNLHLYYLVFASKKEAGKRIMDWVNRQASAGGQLPLDLA